MSVEVRCWAGLPTAHHERIDWSGSPASLPETAGSLLPRGAGRSYGDVCLNPGGSLIDTRWTDRYVAFDPETGVLRCESGLRLGTLLAHLRPLGWTLPVVPGTRWVTVGGALANDVHGKNHRHAGSFGHHVRAIHLLRSDGSLDRLAPGEDRFTATIGGLGLTGLVTEVALQLRRRSGMWLQEHASHARGLDRVLSELDTASAQHEYAAVWLDMTQPDPERLFGLLLAADPIEGGGDASGFARPARIGVGRLPRLPLVGRLSTRVFNAVYRRLAARHPGSRRVDERSCLFTLDSIGDWNRLYGSSGLRQYQCVLPLGTAPGGMEALCRVLSDSRVTCSLAVLKRFGDQRPAGMLSFPREGFTLAMDFPNDEERLLVLFRRLDAIVLEAGGAVYPAKDAHMSRELFRAAFTRTDEFAAHVDPRFSSGFWRRVGA
ncbi:MAG: FAD-binding oxidoreductase [Chitinophagaceae bacterium]